MISSLVMLPLKWYLIDILFIKVHLKPMPLPLLIVALTLNIAFPKITKIFIGHYASLVLSCVTVLWITEMLHPNILAMYLVESIALSFLGDVIMYIFYKLEKKIEKMLTNK